MGTRRALVYSSDPLLVDRSRIVLCLYRYAESKHGGTCQPRADVKWFPLLFPQMQFTTSLDK